MAVSENEAGYSQCFREYNEEGLMKVIGLAAAFIREQADQKPASAPQE